MDTQADIFKLLLLILLMANEKGGCGCGGNDDSTDPFASQNGCSCFGSINSAVLCCLLLNVCNSCGGN